jgi:flagellar P-ring protein precursor FlgI
MHAVNTLRALTTTLAAGLLAFGLAPSATAQLVPLKHLVHVHGQMENVVIGTGLVVGLDGTGSNDPATRQRAINLLSRMTQSSHAIGDITAGNFALVTVTATLPPILQEGQKLDVRVSALSESTSLRGGELLPCELRYHDGPQSVTFVLASGRVSVGASLRVDGAEAQLTRNNPKVGSILGGGTAVRPLIGPLLSEAGHLELALERPSPELAVRIHEKTTAVLGTDVGAGSILGVDLVNAGLVRIRLPQDKQTRADALALLARLGNESVRVPAPAKIVIDVTSGTVVAGGDIPISPGVVAVSSLTITVVEQFEVSQPGPGINNGETAVVGRTQINVTNEGTPTQPNGPPAVIRGEHTTVEDLLNNLKALELSPQQIAVVFEQLAKAGMIHVPVEQV